MIKVADEAIRRNYLKEDRLIAAEYHKICIQGRNHSFKVGGGGGVSERRRHEPRRRGGGAW